jgi:LAO/AO transport system kinase
VPQNTQYGRFLLLLKIAGAGDELQGKRGIMEMADTIVINKADGDNIRKAQLANQSSTGPTSISSKSQAGFLQLQLAVITQDGIPEVWETITKFIELTKSNDYFNENA